MRGRFAAFMFPVLFLPTCALAAQGLPAGFAPASIFASRTNIVAGDTISLFTVLYNSSADALAGNLVFTIDGKDIGTKRFSLKSGETQTPSIAWTAIEGSHTASAHIENVAGAGSDIALANTSADIITLTVAPAPPPSPTAQALASATNVASQVSVQAAPVVNNIYNSLEYLRDNAVRTLENQLAAASPAETSGLSGPAPQVLGTSTANVLENAEKSGFFGTVWRTLLQGLLFICQIKYLFYLALLIILYILYKLVRMVLGGARAY